MKRMIGLLVTGFVILSLPFNVLAVEKAIEWKLQSVYPLTSTPGAQGIRWARFIEDLTNKRLKVDVLPPGAACSASDALNYLSRGVIDAVTAHTGYYTGMFPETYLTSGLPLCCQTWAELWEAMYERGLHEVMQNGFDKFDLLYFPIPGDDYWSFITKFPVNTVDDFKGKKIRVIGITAKYAQALGASVVTTPPEELYMALKLGTVDGTVWGASGLQDLKLGEVVNYWILPHINVSTLGLVFSKKSLNKLPEDIRNMVVKTARYFCGDSGQLIVGYSKKSYYLSLSKHQIKPQTLPEQEVIKMRSKAKPLWDELAAKSPNMKRGIDIMKQFMRDLNRSID